MMRVIQIYWGLGIAGGATLLLWLLLAIGVFERPEWITYDYRMRLVRQDVPLHPDIAVILIDEASLQALNPLVGRWPWPRSIYADLMEFLALGGARAVVFDILFSENELATEGTGHGLNDRRLIETSAETMIAYHAAQILREQLDEGSSIDLENPLPEEFVERFSLKGEGFADRGNNSYVLPLPELYRASQGVGVVSVDADPDSVYRRVNLFATYQGKLYPGLALTPLLDRLGRKPVIANKGFLHLDELTIPLDQQGQFLVNMSGSVKPYSIAGILASIQKLRTGEFDDLLVFPDEFQDKIVFVGASAVGLQDIKTTSTSSKTPGVFIHASVASNLLSGEFLRPIGSFGTLVIVGILALLTVTSILGTLRWYYQVLFPALLAGSYLLLSLLTFTQGIVQPVAAPMAAIAFSWLAASIYMMLIEGRDRRRVRTMFARYVSPAVLSEVVDRYHGDESQIGHRERLSILFSDIRGFTSFSECLPAEQVVKLLNTHFSVMTEIVFRHNGTLDKFIGDAFMAFWGAPVKTEDHAKRAVGAALEMSLAIEQVNQQLKSYSLPAISVGIGINTGEVVLGNIGSERKLDYTAIGDHVNLASRLEGLTKVYHCPILISEHTLTELGGDWPCVLVDIVRVKGKQTPIRLYWPLAVPSASSSASTSWDVVRLADAAHEAYRHRQWKKAEQLYSDLPNEKLREIFVNRCRTFDITPPGADWEGVYNLDTK